MAKIISEPIEILHLQVGNKLFAGSYNTSSISKLVFPNRKVMVLYYSYYD